MRINTCNLRSSWAAVLVLTGVVFAVQAEKINFIYTSDLHYGITRTFRGNAGVTSQTVNEAMIDMMNRIPTLALPDGSAVGSIDFVAITGDIANRTEKGAPLSAVSWSQFQSDYLGNNWNTAGGRLALTTGSGSATPLYFLPGNHDISDAIGYGSNPKDPTSMVEIYNRMMDPQNTGVGQINNAGFSYPADRVNYSVDVGGVHMMFVNMWPDRDVQQWMSYDLSKVSATTPVLLFSHSPIDPAETKVFQDPANPQKFNATYAGDIPFTVGAGAQYDSPAAAAAELTQWLGQHDQVQAYFAGHDNYSDFGTWSTGGTDSIDTFRIDSPMKGVVSSVDETKLSFDVFTIDTEANTLTAREFFWNDQGAATTSGAWGQSETISLNVPDLGASVLLLGLGLLALIGVRRQG
jgi:3',5'-cyclic AMP phosphodiesterase CpdA